MARKMKDSGIEWIGEIPEGWEIRKIKNNFMIYAGATPKSEKTEYWDGGIPWITPADFKTTDKYVSYGRKSLTALGYDSCGTTLVPAGSIIFSKRAPVGSVVIAKNTLCTNQGCLACIPNDAVNSTYFYYCMSIFTEQFELVSAGTTFKEIAASTFASFLLPCPPLSQQNEIVNFLDKESSRIDSMLSKTRSSIEEYKKLKQAVITQAVTKGVRGEREMKDSGVEWIGEINHSFSLIKLKYICSILDQYRKPISADKRSQTGSVLYDYYGASGAIDKIDDYTIDDHVMLIGEDGANLRMRNLPLMYEVNGKAWINNHAHILKPTERVDFYYLFYALEGLDINPYITGSAQPKLSQEKLQNIWVPLPDLEEQQEIATYIRSKCAEIDRLIAKKEQLVKELESYKRSLIYEVVTGKREV